MLEFLAGVKVEQDLREASGDPATLKILGTASVALPAFGEGPEAEEIRRRQAIVAFARDQLGKPYAFGAEVLPGKGSTAVAWDCSELVEAAYRDGGGLQLPDGCVNQQAAMQRARRWLAGDLLFLRPNAQGVRHVLIFTGEASFVHAAGGRGVVEDPEAMWLQHARAEGPYRHLDFARPPEDRA